VCPALCSGNGEYESGRCKCNQGWTGDDCQLPSEHCAGVYCSQHGQCVDGRCVCASGFTGIDCFHGLFSSSLLIRPLYPPSERSETGRYTVFTLVCLSVCLSVCAHQIIPALWAIKTRHVYFCDKTLANVDQF